jgi:tetratricopeptide (TPR) repeat protein
MKKELLCFVFLFCAFFASSQSEQRPDALKMYQDGNFARAIEICEQELSENPRNLDSYTVLCWSLIRNRQYAEAEQRANQARLLSWYDHRVVEALAEAKYFLGKNSESLALFHEYVSLIPDIAVSRTRMGQAYYYMGELYIRQARYEHADIALTTASHVEPNIDSWWTRLGYAREMAQSYDKAVEAYDKALALNAGSLDAARGKERSLSRLSR